MHPPRDVGAPVVERERSRQVAAAVRERPELVQGPQQEGVVGVDVGDDRAQVRLDRVEVLLRLEDARHDRAHLGEGPAQAETLGQQGHLVADDGGLDERAVVDERWTRATSTRTRRSSASSPMSESASSVSATESMGRSRMRERMTSVESRSARAPGSWAVPGWSRRSRSRSIARIGSPATIAAREARRVTSSRSASSSSSHERARSRCSSAS